MLKIDYNIPIFEDTDAADLNKYSNEMAKALKTQINNTNNEIKEIDQKVVDAVNKFTEPLNYKGSVLNYEDLPIINTNGDIYTVTSENKNYIWNGTTWEEYASNIDLTPIEEQLKTTQITDIAEALTITDCAGVNGKLDIVNGKSIQDGEPTPDIPSDIRNVGDNINILNNTLTSETRNGITITVNKDKTITINGTATALTVFPLGEVNLVKNNTYTLSGADNGSTSSYRLDMRLSAGGNIYNGWLHAPKDSDNKPTYTMTENITLYPHLRIQSGATINNVIIYPKVEESPIATSHSEYGCGSVGIKVGNKNKLRFINPISYKFATQTINGVTITNNEDGSFTLNGTSTGEISKQLSDTMSNLKVGTYYLSRNSSGTVSNGAFATILYGKNNGQTTQIKSMTTEGSVLETSVDYDEYYLWLYISAGKTFNNYVLKPQLEEGEVNTGWALYQEQTVVFPLSKGQLLHKGDYLAKNGTHQVRKTRILNGTENISASEYGTNTYVLEIASEIKFYTTKIVVISSHFNGVSYIDRTISKTNIIYAENANKIYFRGTNFATLDEFKTFLAEQYANGTPVLLEYDIEETVTPYTPEQEKAYYELQHLLMYEGYTSIECIDEIKPDIQVTYLYNNEINKSYGTRFDKVEDNIKKLEDGNTYSAEEKIIGKWIDGKTIYRKVVDIGTLPNTSTKSVVHNIIDLDHFTLISGIAYANSKGAMPLPYTNATLGNIVVISADVTNIHIGTGMDRTIYHGYVILEYTKTTD